MAYDLYVLNQRLPRFPLRDGYEDAHALRDRIDRVFHAWLVEALVGNLQRRKACAQVFEFAGWMEKEALTLETVAGGDFQRFALARGEPALCRFADFLVLGRKKIPQLAWEN